MDIPCRSADMPTHSRHWEQCGRIDTLWPERYQSFDLPASVQRSTWYDLALTGSSLRDVRAEVEVIEAGAHETIPPAFQAIRTAPELRETASAAPVLIWRMLDKGRRPIDGAMRICTDGSWIIVSEDQGERLVFHAYRRVQSGADRSAPGIDLGGYDRLASVRVVSDRSEKCGRIDTLWPKRYQSFDLPASVQRSTWYDLALTGSPLRDVLAEVEVIEAGAHETIPPAFQPLPTSQAIRTTPELRELDSAEPVLVWRPLNNKRHDGFYLRGAMQICTDGSWIIASEGQGSVILEFHAYRRVKPVLSERDSLIHSFRREGKALEEIGKYFGLSRERIRQILNHTDGPTYAQVQGLKKESDDEKRSLLAHRVNDDIRIHPGSTWEEIATRLSVSPLEARTVASNELKVLVLGVERYDSEASNARRVYAIEALQHASTYAFPLTTKKYSELVASKEVAGPSVPTIYNYFGSWRDACGAAGIECGEALRENYSSRWTDDDLLNFVYKYLTSPNASGSFDGYDKWVAETDGAPSGGTLRKRFKSWANIKNKALLTHAEKHGLPPGGTQ